MNFSNPFTTLVITQISALWGSNPQLTNCEACQTQAQKRFKIVKHFENTLLQFMNSSSDKEHSLKLIY